jgi:hypothetical protein
MFFTFTEFKHWLLDGPDQPLPQQLAKLKQAMGDVKPPRVVYATPERDELKPSCVHMYSDSDVLALQLKREREQKDQPRNVRIFVRSVNS